MERRSFLGLLVAGVAMPLLPAAAETIPLANQQIWTAATLAAEMEKMFACRMGPATAFFEVIKGTDQIVEAKPDDVPRKLWEKPVVLPDRDQFIYGTYGFAVEGGEAWEAEHRLAKHFYEQFSKFDGKNLVWRRKPVFATEEVTEYGDVWASSEAIEDRPDFLYNKPDNVELDPSWGNYRYVTRKYPLHRMTMRLVFTDQQTELAMARVEGAPLLRIS